MALSDIVSSLLDPILQKIKQLLGPFGKLFDLLQGLWKNSVQAFTTGQELAGEIITEIQAWKNFKEDIAFRTGVISLPKAIEKTKALIDEIIAAWHAIVDLAKNIQKQLQGQQESPIEEAEQAAADIESSGFKTILEKFPKLAKALEKVLGFLAIVVGTLESIIAAINDLKAIVDAIRDIREEIEHGSTIFLSQKNARKTLKLKDGGSIKIRVGSLHAS